MRADPVLRLGGSEAVDPRNESLGRRTSKKARCGGRDERWTYGVVAGGELADVCEVPSSEGGVASGEHQRHRREDRHDLERRYGQDEEVARQPRSTPSALRRRGKADATHAVTLVSSWTARSWRMTSAAPASTLPAAFSLTAVESVVSAVTASAKIWDSGLIPAHPTIRP